MLNPEPETAQVVHLLLCTSRRIRLLEVGTSNGYSTIWLAWAASLPGGQVTSIDRDPHKQALADANLRQVGLREVVDLQCGESSLASLVPSTGSSSMWIASVLRLNWRPCSLN